MTINDGITDEQQYAAARADLATFPDGLDPLTAWLSGSKWARVHLAAQEPTDADAYVAHIEWMRHSPRFVKAGVIRCSCGVPGHWGTDEGHNQHALWHALRAARRDEEER